MNGVRVTGITLTVLIWSVLGLESVWALSNPRGMLFRAVGIYQGEVEEGKCTVPSATGGFADYSRAVCRDSTELVTDDGAIVFPTRMFPDLTTYGNYCGGFLVLQNGMINQAINVYKVKVRYKMPGRGFPILCRAYRKFTLGVGSTVPPVNSTFVNPFGAVNVSVMQLLPIYSPDLLSCLRDPLRGNVAAPVTVRAKIRAFGVLDDGHHLKSNKLNYSLTLLPAGWESGPSGGLYPRADLVRCGSPVP